MLKSTTKTDIIRLKSNIEGIRYKNIFLWVNFYVLCIHRTWCEDFFLHALPPLKHTAPPPFPPNQFFYASVHNKYKRGRDAIFSNTHHVFCQYLAHFWTNLYENAKINSSLLD